MTTPSGFLLPVDHLLGSGQRTATVPKLGSIDTNTGKRCPREQNANGRERGKKTSGRFRLSKGVSIPKAHCSEVPLGRGYLLFTQTARITRASPYDDDHDDVTVLAFARSRRAERYLLRRRRRRAFHLRCCPLPSSPQNFRTHRKEAPRELSGKKSLQKSFLPSKMLSSNYLLFICSVESPRWCP